ncbi:MAG: co-chaperone GroES [candidate division WWE3 bacterium]|nr:co-chaperone GroES [candidate division WWE3 bacterium]
MFTPLFSNVLIEPLEGEQKTASGIIIPDSAREKPQKGKIIAAGPGKTEDGKLTPVSVKIGDTVMYKKWGGTDIKVDGKDYLIVEEKDILGVLN